MKRSNEAWMAQLGAEGAEQDSALADLRAVLLRGLRAALATHGSVDAGFCEDIAQEALLRILDRLPQFEGRSRFESWAIAIAIRLAFSELRRSRWKDVSLDALVADGGTRALPSATIDAEPASRLEQRSMVEKMYEVIRRELTDKQRLALGAELRGMPLDEIARQLGSNRNAVYKLTHDARKRLKRGLEHAGFALVDVRAAFVG